jgi:mannose-6-phosphate isomerase-like protein (cupin superfamily)
MKTEEMFVGFSVGAGDDRFGEHIKLGGPEGEPIDCKVSAQDTDGALCVFEFNCNAGGPKHCHRDEDEWIYVVNSEFEFHVADRQFRAGPGESVFIPRKVGHVWGRVCENPGRIINVYQPAGRMEEFFREIGKYDGKPAIHEALWLGGLRQFFDMYGMDLLGRLWGGTRILRLLGLPQNNGDLETFGRVGAGRRPAHNKVTTRRRSGALCVAAKVQ